MAPSGDRTISYARNGDVHIAYTVLGDGPIDLVYTNGIFSNLDVMWEDPHWSRYADRLASFSRLIVFDMRGIGVSPGFGIVVLVPRAWSGRGNKPSSPLTAATIQLGSMVQD